MENDNVLLADFLGWRTTGVGNGLGRIYDYELPNGIELIGESDLHYCSDCGRDSYDMDYCFVEDLIFHKDWNWLMLVVSKIESLDNIISFKIASYIEIEYWTNNSIGLISITDVKPKIEATYKACLEFVKWYNENK